MVCDVGLGRQGSEQRNYGHLSARPPRNAKGALLDMMLYVDRHSATGDIRASSIGLLSGRE